MNPAAYFIHRFGLFSCCIRVATSHEQSSPGRTPEGTVLVCMDCGTEMVVQGRTWRWKEAADSDPGI